MTIISNTENLENASTKKTLIVAYSYSGNTHRIAQGLQAATGGDFCEIYPWQPYPMSFPELLEQVKLEIHAKYQPKLLPVSYTPCHYQIIFVGTPNWCGTIAPPLYSWLCNNDLSGKIILPFCSHGGGGFGNIQRDIARLCRKSDVRQGVSIQNDGGETLMEQISKWLHETAVWPVSAYTAATLSDQK